MGKLDGKRIAFLVAPEGVEQVELTEPWKAVEEAGGKPELISLESGEFQAFNHLDKARHVPRRPHGRRGATPPTTTALVLPGGVANPDFLRMDEDAVALRARVLRAGQAGRRRSATARGRWSRPTCAGRTLTSWPSLQTDIRNAGGTGSTRRSWSTRASSPCRNPDDLPAFCDKIVEEFCEGEHEGAVAQRRAPRPLDRRDHRHRRHARRHELPPRDRVVPRVPRARVRGSAVADPPPASGWAATSWSPPWSARTSTSEHGDEHPRRGEAGLHGAHRRGRAARGRPRADRRARERGYTVVLASSAKPDEVEHYIELLGVRDLVARLDDVGRRGADQARARPRHRGDREGRRGRRGDDRRLGVGLRGGEARRVPTIGVLTGGFSREELEEAGAATVFDSIVELKDDLDSTPLG